MEELQEKFTTKVEVAKECLEYLAGDPEATLKETNSAMIEVGELKRKMQILKTVVDKLKLQTKQAENIAGHIHERIENIEYLNENLPKVMVANGQQKSKVQKPAKDEKEKKSSTVNGAKNEPQAVKTVPKVRHLTLDDFEKIPKYMKGRLNYDGVNTSIDEFNSALEARYAFLGKGFQAMASMAMKKKYKEMKTQETRETRGVYFVVADDLKPYETLKSESSRRNIFTIFRHFHLIREIRGPQSLVRYAVVEGR